ncbi:peptidoglycan DD-metalloendopeptidase family protein [Qipengyuania sp. MTN3-11]|uniref:M23 family metallopeptidase n=1 Tax=Qipengyuania sp. MTN3-11 TaxID=3056557 RepID=UPI0036F3E4DC
MTIENNATGGWIARVRGWFPERELFMRSEGRVRFLTISSRLQMTAAGLGVAALLAWGVSLGAMGWQQYRASADRASLLDREASVAKSEHRLEAYRDDIDAVTRDLQQRQDFLDAAFSSLPEDVKSDSHVGDSRSEAAETIDKVGMALPGAAALARIEARQLAFAEGLTRFADGRASRAENALRQLGLDPAEITRNAERQAMGGPLEPLLDDEFVDPRFERLGLSLARMSALEQGLESVPQFLPASLAGISSGFGFRRDPFTGTGAMHQGLDFRGAVGSPIHAAAKGRVTYAGWKSGYGKTVEIAHGNGVTTRYAHMSRFAAKPGDQVLPGAVIGAIGSTGRSTGPHLHFEVRIDGRAVNPRTFLEQAPDVLKEIRRAPRLSGR